MDEINHTCSRTSMKRKSWWSLFHLFSNQTHPNSWKQGLIQPPLTNFQRILNQTSNVSWLYSRFNEFSGTQKSTAFGRPFLTMSTLISSLSFAYGCSRSCDSVRNFNACWKCDSQVRKFGLRPKVCEIMVHGHVFGPHCFPRCVS